MIEYLVVSIICILITLFPKKKESALAYSFVILTVFFAIRYNFGNDYFAYLTHFDLANQGNLLDALESERFEDGWVVLCRLCKPIGFFGMVIILTVFENFVLYRMIKKYVPRNWYWLALFCYLFSTSLCLTGLSMMRQYFAMCVCLLAFDMAVTKRIVLSVLLVLLAGLFHTSAYVCLPVCFIGLLKNVRVSKSFSIVLIAFIIVLSLASVSLFSDYLADFIRKSVFEIYEGRLEQNNERIIGLSTFFNYYLLMVILLLQGKLNNVNRYFVIIFILYYIIDVFKPIAPLINRVGLYFFILYPVCMPNTINKLSDKTIRQVTVLLLLLFGVYGYFSFILSPGWGNTFLEYNTIFSVNYWM